MRRSDPSTVRPFNGSGRRPKLSPEQANELRQWAAGRKTLRAKAAELGISVSAAREYINAVHAVRQQ